MHYLNDPPLPITAIYYAFFLILIAALILALLRPWHRAWKHEQMAWFCGVCAYCVLAWGIGAETPHPYPNVRGFGDLIWVVGVLSFFLGLFQKPSLDPRVSSSSRIEFVLAIVCSFVLFIVALPQGGHPREASYRTQCKNNLKQIMLAVWNDHDTRSRFAASSEGNPPHSWRVTLLPYMDQTALFSRYQFPSTWDSAENHPIAATPMTIFQCPSRQAYVGESGLHDEQQRYFSHYARLTGGHTAGGGISVKEITDGASNTAMVVEACGVDRVRTAPVDVDIDTQPIGINLPSPAGFQSPGWISSHHARGAFVALADGSVRFVSADIDPKVLKSLTTIDGRESIGSF